MHLIATLQVSKYTFYGTLWKTSFVIVFCRQICWFCPDQRLERDRGLKLVLRAKNVASKCSDQPTQNRVRCTHPVISCLMKLLRCPKAKMSFYGYCQFRSSEPPPSVPYALVSWLHVPKSLPQPYPTLFVKSSWWNRAKKSQNLSRDALSHAGKWTSSQTLS